MKKEIRKIKDFEASFNLSEKTVHILKGEALDREEYNEALSEIEDAGRFIANITDEEYVSECVKQIDEAYDKRDTNRLAKRIGEKARRGQKRRFARVVTLTASVAAAVVVVVVQIFNRGEVEKSFVAESNIDIANYTIPVVTTDLNYTTNVDTLTSDDIKSTFVAYSEMQKIDEKANVKSKLIVPKGFTQKVKLADGTVVTLNSQSILTYPQQFNGDKRVVELSGEGYFDVEKGTKPFIVKVNDIEVTVYGTEFNINEFNGTIETLLVEGSVGVSKSSESGEVVLIPNQMLVYNKSISASDVIEVVPQKYLGWLTGEFDYRGSTLSELLRDMSRWYGVEFTTKENIDERVISLYAERDIELEEIFKLLSFSWSDLVFINEGYGKYTIEKKIFKFIY